MSSWTKEDARVIIESLYNRASSNPSHGFRIRSDDTSIIFSKYSDSNIYISLSAHNRLYISINDTVGTVSPSLFFWRDKQFKLALKNLRSLYVPTKSNSQIILDIFPEAVGIEFEKEILDGKK